MAEYDKAADVLEKLIETCRDGENGYRDAAEHVKSADLKTLFREKSGERARFATELQMELERMGKPKKENGSVSAALHRAWLDLKSDLGGGDKSVLNAVEQGEDNAKKNYEEALQESLPANLVSIIIKQAQAVVIDHDQAKTLRDQRAA